jgi:hypothetical protein
MPFFKCIFKDLLTNLNVRFCFFSKRDSWKPPTYQTKLTSFEKNCHILRRSLSCTLYLVFKHFLQKGNVIRRNLKIPNARVRLICAVMTLESFSCVFCQSEEFDCVTDWLKHSLQAIVVYVKYLFMFQNDYKRLGHSVICSIDYWLLYVNRKFKWYELSGSEMS